VISRGFRSVIPVAVLISLIAFVPLADAAVASRSREERTENQAGQLGENWIFSLSGNFFGGEGLETKFDLLEPVVIEKKGGSELARKKHFWRALLETSVFLGVFQIRYKQTHTTWVEGVHKYRATWEDQKEKIFNWNNWNYDANCFRLNWGHALAGGIYYNFSRTNNLNVLESFLMSWASSSYWEFVVEYRSDVSLNDHIMTPLGGLSVGEAWFQLGKFFADRSDPLSQVLSFVNPILKLNRFFDRERIKKMPPEPKPGWHEFSIDLGLRNIRVLRDDQNRTALYAGLQTQIMSIPEYGHQGMEHRLVKKTLFSEIQLDITGLGRTPEEFHLFTRAVLFGYFWQHIDSLNRGYALYLGGGSAFSMFKKKEGTSSFPCTFKGRDPSALKLDEARDFSDRMATVHIFGPVFDWTLFAKDLNIRFVQDIYVDFGITHSFVFNAYTHQFDYSGVKTPLLVNGYYYGWGTTMSSRLDVSWRNASVQGYLRYQRYGSIDGKDRFQHLVTDDFHLTDSRFLCRAAVGYRIPGLPLWLKASYEGIYRRGSIENMVKKAWETRGFLGLAVEF
jgi:hypothetical protein